MPLLETALRAAKTAGIPPERVFTLGIPGHDKAASFASVDDLVAEGRQLPELEPLRWTRGQGARQPAFLCYSSGTSGLPVSLFATTTGDAGISLCVVGSLG